MPKLPLAANASPPPTCHTFVPPTFGTPDYFAMHGYGEWLHMELRLLRHTMGWGSALLVTPARDFHIPTDGRNWCDVPAPATRAMPVLNFVGIDTDALSAWARAEASEWEADR
ncbi:hypothetical protein ACLBXM_09110 [Xanthobacteraceae bacterium A53D]